MDRRGFFGAVLALPAAVKAVMSVKPATAEPPVKLIWNATGTTVGSTSPRIGDTIRIRMPVRYTVTNGNPYAVTIRQLDAAQWESLGPHQSKTFDV